MAVEVYGHKIRIRKYTGTYPNGTTTYSYDAWGPPSAQTRTAIDGVTQNIEYYYGMDNKLVRTDARDWPDFNYQIQDTYRGDGKRHYENHFAGASGWGGLTTTYHYGAGYDVLTEEHAGEVKTMIGGLAEAIGDSSSVGTYRYFTHDHLGSVREVRDESFGLNSEFAYGPYGESYFAHEAAFGLGPSDLGHVSARSSAGASIPGPMQFPNLL